MSNFVKRPEWILTFFLFSVGVIVRTVCAYAKPDIFLTYMHVAITECLIISLVMGQLVVRLSRLYEAKPVMYFIVILTSFAFTTLICDFVAQYLINGKVNLLLPIASCVVTAIVLFAIFNKGIFKNKGK